jgi:hypothetical protein
LLKKKREKRGQGTPPGNLYEFQNKGVAAKGVCMNMKTKGREIREVRNGEVGARQRLDHGCRRDFGGRA